MSCGLTPGRNLPHNQIIMMLVIAWGCSKLSKSHEASEETELSGINGSLGWFFSFQSHKRIHVFKGPWPILHINIDDVVGHLHSLTTFLIDGAFWLWIKLGVSRFCWWIPGRHHGFLKKMVKFKDDFLGVSRVSQLSRVSQDTSHSLEISRTSFSLSRKLVLLVDA